jgi:4-hydroxythreonine-4-phosphate dehydrogenase
MKIGITLGDPAGIGPEIILKGVPKLTDHQGIVIFGNKKILRRTAADLKLQTQYKIIEGMVCTCVDDMTFAYGKPTARTGHAALQSINSALRYGVDILITTPIVKDVIRYSVPGFVGHTEYLARFFCVKDFAMMGLWHSIRIMLLTTHIPLRDIFKSISVTSVCEKISFLDHGLKKYFGITHPRIAVSALNPHAFEFSRGEDEKIKAGIDLARKKRIKAQGPFPGDSLFHRTYDGFLSMYHDQAFVFLKSKKTGLNFTMGLPIVRLSPLYGAALDIAGKNRAETDGFVAACTQGKSIFRNLKSYEKNS